MINQLGRRTPTFSQFDGCHFPQLLNVHGVNDIRHTEIHTAEPLVPEPSGFEVEMAIETLQAHKSLGIDQIPAELIKAGVRTICSVVHKLINSLWNKQVLPEEWVVDHCTYLYEG